MNKNINSSSAKLEYTQVFNQHYAYVFRIAYGLSGNRADAEDICQETFLAIYKSLKNFRGEAKLSSWIYRITVRIATRHLNKNKKNYPYVYSSETENLDTTHDLIQAISSLNLPLRMAITLVAIQGMTHVEAAEILGVPDGTIASRVYTAKKLLSEKLKL